MASRSGNTSNLKEEPFAYYCRATQLYDNLDPNLKSSRFLKEVRVHFQIFHIVLQLMTIFYYKLILIIVGDVLKCLIWSTKIFMLLSQRTEETRQHSRLRSRSQIICFFLKKILKMINCQLSKLLAINLIVDN